MKKRKDIVFFKKSTSCTFVTLNFLVCTAPFLFPIYLMHCAQQIIIISIIAFGLANGAFQ